MSNKILVEYLQCKNNPDKYVYVINAIESESEEVVLPVYRNSIDYNFSNGSLRITHIGYKTVEDTRSDFERLQDDYRFYVFPIYLVEKEVYVSPNIKKIVISKYITDISEKAFRNVKGLTFIIEEGNEVFEIKEGKLINKTTNKVIYQG